MKHEKWYSALCGAGLAFLVSFGAVSCVSTGFFMTDVPLYTFIMSQFIIPRCFYLLKTKRI